MAKKAAAKSAAKKLKVTLVRSPIGFNKTQGKTVEGMGLRRIRHTVELPDTPETRPLAIFDQTSVPRAVFLEISGAADR